MNVIRHSTTPLERRRSQSGLRVSVIAGACVLGQLLAPAIPAADAQDCDGWVAIGEPGPRAGHALVYDSARNVIVMFGGTPDGLGGSGGTTRHSETWEFDGSRWIFRTLEGPSPRTNANMAYDPVRQVTVLFGGVAGSFANDTWEWDGIAWRVRQPTLASTGLTDRPPNPSFLGMGFDPIRGQVIAAGGLNGTWAWDGQRWTALIAPNGPGDFIGTRCASIIDPDTQRLVLISATDTVAWTGSTWERLGPGTGLSTDKYAIVNPETGKIAVLHAFAGPSAAVREWDGNFWRISTIAVPGSRVAWARMGNDPTVVALGYPATQASAWIGPSQWTVAAGVFTPRGRPAPTAGYAPAAAFDESRGVSVLFGGSTDGGQILGRETWELRGETWLLRSTTGPQARTYAGMAFDPRRAVCVLKGGQGDGPETWEWNGTWSQSPAAPRSIATNCSMVYDPIAQRMLLIGVTSGGALELVNGTWNPLSVSIQSNAAVGFDPSRNGTLVSTLGTQLLAGSALTSLVSNNQTNYYLPALAYDPERQAMVLVGGFLSPSGGASFPGSWWTLSAGANTWTLQPTRTPGGRKFHRLVYDSLSKRVMMFGGGTHSPALRETWKLARGPAAIARQPAQSLASAGERATLFTIASGGGTIVYQWFKNGVPVLNAGRISGADTDTLTIDQFTPDDAGNYTVRVSNPCGQQTSQATVLRCMADFDGVGGVTISDVTNFIGAWLSGDASADVNLSGALSVEDLFVFLRAWFGGC